jgi:hypothetical protein
MPNRTIYISQELEDWLLDLTEKAEHSTSWVVSKILKRAKYVDEQEQLAKDNTYAASTENSTATDA